MSDNSARQPLPLVLVNGVAASGIMDVTVHTSSFYCADRFCIRAAQSASSSFVWSGIPLTVEVRIIIGSDELSLITGNADSISIDSIRGEMRIEGRDFAALFVGAQLDESFENQTSSDIVTQLAQRRGLNADVEATTTIIGRYYQNGRTRTSLPQHARATTEWDLLCWLAQLEGYDVWVSGRSLFFKPAPPVSPTFGLTPRNCKSLQLDHALDVAAGVMVTVKSWDSVSQSAVVASASVGSGGIQRVVIRPNLSTTDAQALASELARQTSSHERQVLAGMPGELTIMPRAVMALSQTETDFDGMYSVVSIERRIGFSHGFSQLVEARSLPWITS